MSKIENNRDKGEVDLRKSFSNFVKEQQEAGKSKDQIYEDIFYGPWGIIEFDETQGKASLVFQSWQSPISYIGEKQPIGMTNIKEFRRLRANFPPVAAGVDWHKDFCIGGGFEVQVSDPKDTHQLKMKKDIDTFCEDIHQDQYTIGLDKLLDILIDIALTDGCAAAEIVYEEEVSFNSYIKGFEEVTLPNGEKVLVMDPKEPKWEGLRGIVKLKIIENAVERLIPYRHPLSGEVLFWTLDEKGVQQTWATRKAIEKKVVKFHPWEIFWLSWNQQGTNLKGSSIIQAVYTVTKFVEEIQKAVGIGFKRWANKKYFFVSGSEKRPWSKVHMNQFVKGMEKMIKNNWVGVPVPAGFSIEEIGGEESVFEGKNLLDYLTSMICAGMRYPKEFLETGTQNAGDKAWLAWTVHYGRSQQQIRRAIEHQLFKRELWCLHGKKYRKGKKGLRIDKQPMVSIYIPKIQWRAEGRYHREKKIELLTSIMNVANPVDAPLKLGISREMAKTLGLGDLDWTKIDELFKIREDNSILEAELEALELKHKIEMGKQGKFFTRAQPLTPDEELRRKTDKRLVGGVTKSKKPGKNLAREVGGTRMPDVAETVTDALGLRDMLIETEKLKQEKLKEEIAQIERKKKLAEALNRRIK